MNPAATVAAEQPHLGVGWAFPPRWDPPEATGTGRAAVRLTTAHLDGPIRSALELILRTTPGERVMRPDFGAGVDDYVFGPRTAETCSRLAFAVERAIVKLEPRVLVERVEALPRAATTDGVASEERGDRIDVVIEYRLDRHRRPSNLVLPFYFEAAP